MGNEASTANNGAGVSTTCSNANSCRTCKGLGNRETDTVKIDLDALASRGKENAGDQQIKETAAQKQQRMEAEKRRAEKRRAEEEDSTREEERRIRQAEEAKRRAEEERRHREQEQERIRAVQEAKRRVEEEQKRLRALEEQRLEEERRAAEELRRAQEEERRCREEEQRMREKMARGDEARRRKEMDEKAQKLAVFLKDHGFQGVNEKQKKKGIITSGFIYPLHAAVEANDPAAVDLLLQHGADPSIQSSKKQTPLKLAETKNKAGSHKRVIALLQGSQKA